MYKCKKHGSRFCMLCLWATVSFPLEHFLWEKAPILSGITKALGL